MKKIFIFLGMSVGLSPSFSLAMDLASAQSFTGPRNCDTSSNLLVNQTQSALLESVQGVFEVLKTAEGSYPSYDSSDFSAVPASYSGLSEVIVDAEMITFTFNPTEINPNLNVGTFALQYSPISGQGGPSGWTCVMSISPSLGSSFIVPSEGFHPLTKGLGWPYAECTIS